MKNKLRDKKGFTLIEILISTAIFVILGAVVLGSFYASRKVYDLTTSSQRVLSVLRLAQARTLAGEDNSVWGTRLESNRMTLFRGDTFGSATLTHVYDLPPSIELTSVTLNGGGIDVIFNRITGTTDYDGSFVLRSIDDTTNFLSFTVHNSGKIDTIGIFPPLADTRIIDTRHRAFTLGWSIKTANTLTLTFANPPNPDVVQPITMSPFFDTGKTKFDWSDTVVIDGAAQQLRIHTTLLDDTNTILSVDRDCRKNIRKLTITIDGKTIAVYEADCRTLAIGAFGGVVLEP